MSRDPGEVLAELVRRVEKLEDRGRGLKSDGSVKTTSLGPHRHDAAEVRYTPETPADWDGGVDPGNTDDAADQLAARVTDLEAGVGTHPNLATHDALGLATDAELAAHEADKDVHFPSQAAVFPTLWEFIVPVQIDDYVDFGAIGSPATPAASVMRVYHKTTDSRMYYKDEAGVEHEIGVDGHVADPDPHAGYLLESLIDAAGDLLYGSADNTPARLAIGTAAYKLHVASGLPAWTKDYVPILIIIDGGGATITTGVKADVYLLENLTVEGWTLLADQSGSIQLDIWQDTYANFPPTVADTITASDKPLISSATKGQDLAPTGWDSTLDAGSSLRINVDSVTTIQRVTLTLHCYRR